jgi:hypothetical protein
MSVQPVSQVSMLFGIQPGQNHARANQNATPAQEPTDIVQLSAAAQAHLRGADADGDGDGH